MEQSDKTPIFFIHYSYVDVAKIIDFFVWTNYLRILQNDKFILAGTYQGYVKLLNLHTGAVSLFLYLVWFFFLKHILLILFLFCKLL